MINICSDTLPLLCLAFFWSERIKYLDNQPPWSQLKHIVILSEQDYLQEKLFLTFS